MFSYYLYLWFRITWVWCGIVQDNQKFLMAEIQRDALGSDFEAIPILNLNPRAGETGTYREACWGGGRHWTLKT